MLLLLKRDETPRFQASSGDNCHKKKTSAKPALMHERHAWVQSMSFLFFFSLKKAKHALVQRKEKKRKRDKEKKRNDKKRNRQGPALPRVDLARRHGGCRQVTSPTHESILVISRRPFRPACHERSPAITSRLDFSVEHELGGEWVRGAGDVAEGWCGRGDVSDRRGRQVQCRRRVRETHTHTHTHAHTHTQCHRRVRERPPGASGAVPSKSS